ncbi:MAG: ATP-binding protein [Lachnospiraceae bacterium]|nr:ATP-binding protein [Lachnospiraceae bacterium]
MALTNAQYNIIMAQYSERQATNAMITRERREEIDQKLPQVKDIEMQVERTAHDYIQRALNSSNQPASLSSPAMLQKELERLSQKKKELLRGAGYPEDYLEPIYTCKDCKDTGYIGNQKCHCFEKAITELFYSSSNAVNIQKNQCFANFSLDLYDKNYYMEDSDKSAYENMCSILDSAKTFVREFGNENPTNKNLLLFGQSGLGKTFLSNCIANALLEKNYRVISLSAIELFQLYEKTTFHRYDEDEAEAKDQLGEITACDLLIIDDLGTELTNSFTNSRLFYIINDRILKNKSTIISSNFELTEFYETYSERIFSRIMHNYKALRFFGGNIRMGKVLNKI